MPVWIICAFAVMNALCIYGAVKLYSSSDAPYGKAVIGSLAFYAAVFALVWIFGIDVPAYTLFLTMLTVFVSCFMGHYLQLYNKSKTFDRYLHAFGTFSFALLTYAVLDDFLLVGGSLIYRALFIVFLGNTIGVVFELFEMLSDLKRNTPRSQKGLRDTDMDELFNLIGSILAGAFSYLWVLQ